MKKGSTANFTLKNTNERIDSLENKIDQILRVLSEKSNDEENPILVLNTNSLKSDVLSADEFLITLKSFSEEFTDDHGNVFVQLPTVWIKIDGELLNISFYEKDGFIQLTPQAISKYKGSLIKGELRSIPNVAPNFSQFSFNKSTKFCEWVDGEQLNWKTVLYIQIMWTYAYQTKNNNEIISNENYIWNEERDCAFSDTGKGTGEFLGIEQLFTSGRSFVSFDNREGFEKFWKLYITWNYDSSFEPNGEHGVWGDYGQVDHSHSAHSSFFSGWDGVFSYAWDCGDVAVRLCKAPLEKGC